MSRKKNYTGYEGKIFTGCYPNKNSFERSLKRFQPSEKGFAQQPPYYWQMIFWTSVSNNVNKQQSRIKIFRSFLSFNSSKFLPEIETQLKVLCILSSTLIKAGFVREKQILSIPKVNSPPGNFNPDYSDPQIPPYDDSSDPDHPLMLIRENTPQPVTWEKPVYSTQLLFYIITNI